MQGRHRFGPKISRVPYYIWPLNGLGFDRNGGQTVCK